MVAQLENDKNIQVVKKPVAGEVREVAVGSELDVSFDFDLGSVQAAKDGDDLVLTFEDESVVKLLGFANELEPIDVVLQDGTVISAEAIMEAIGDDGFINTAAGAASSSPQGSGSSSLEGFGEALSGIENQEINHSYDDSSRAFVSSDVTGVENTPVVAIDDSSSVLAAELTNILDGAANPSVSGNVLSNDIDPDGDTLSVTGSTSNAQYGTFVINKDGTWTYTLDNQNGDIVALDDGESRTDSITYTVSDGLSSDTATLTVTINGTNDAPTVVADAGGVTAEEYHDVNANILDVPTASGNVLDNDSDLDIEDITVLDPGTYEGAYGTLVIGEYGSWTYTLDPNNPDVQGLNIGSDPLHDTFKYSATDGTASTESELVIDVHGTNDRPEVAAATVDGVTESFVGKEIVADVTEQAARTPENDVEDIGGVLTFTDVDNNDHGNAEAAGGLDLTYNWSVNGGDASVVTADGLAGEYGSLTYNVSTGRWDYTLNDANAQQLGEGQSFDETFQISVDDGHGGTEVQNIVVTVNGTNDAPEVAAATVDGVTESFVGKEIVADVTEQAARTPENDVEDIGGVLTFTDVDNNDHGNAEAAGGLDLTYNWSVNGGDASVVTADGLAGEYGSLTYNVSTGRWDYTLNDANAQQLGEGQSFDETFQISVDDGHGGTEVQNIVVTVNGTNDAPEVAAATVDGVTESFVGKEIVADVTEQAARTPENDAEDIGGVLTFTDVDNNDHGNAEAAGGLDLTYNWSVNGGDASVVTADGLAGEYGSLTYNVSTGRWDYTLNDANAQQLGEGQSFDETFQISVDDGHGGTEVQNIVVTVNGTNDAPEVAAATVDGVIESFVGKEIVADVTEQAARTPENDVEDIGGVLTFTDVDNNDHGNAEAAGGLDLTYNWSVNGGDASVVTADGLAGEYGSLTYNVSTGRWDYTLNDANAQQLGEGQSFDETFQISVDDGHGGTEVQNIVVTVNGTNDAPEVAAATVDGVTESFVGKEIVADVTEQAARTPENDVEDIGGVLTFTDVDNNDHGNAEAAGGLDLTYNWSVNGGDASVVTAGGLAGEYGSLTYNVSTGRWDYTLNDANAQQLGEGQSFDETFQISVDDGHGGTEVQKIVVTVNGTNDAPEVAAATVDGVTESFVGKEIVANVTEQAARTPENDVEDIGGVLTFTDVDNNDHGNAEAAGGLDLTYNWSVNGGDATVVTAGGLAGEYGSLTYNVSTGRWDYILNDANAQQLGEGQSFDETFQISVDDGHGGTEVQKIVVTVNGTNDAPEVAAATVDGVTESFVGKEIVANVTEQAARTPENDVEDIGGVLTFTDVDNNDHGNAEAAGGLDLTYNWSVNGGDASVVTAGGLAGEYGSLTYNVSTGRWDYTLNDANAQQLGEGQSFDETFQISVDDGHGGTEVQKIVVTVNGTNDAPEVAAATVDGVTESFVGKEIVANVTEQAARTPENDVEDIGGVLTFTDVDNNDHGNAEAAGGLDLTYNWSVNGGDATVVTAGGLAGEYGSLTYNVSTGRWDYILNDANAQQLGEGQSFDETFQISVDDGHGGTEVQKIVVTVNGTNDAPVVAEATNSETGQTFAEGQDITGTVTESGQWEAGDSSATGTLTFTDPDRNDEGNAEVGGSGSLTYQVSSDLNTSSSDLYDQNDSQNNDSSLEVVGKYGDLTYDTENGTWTYTLDNDREATKELIDGQEVHESFTVVATDDAGASVEKVIDVEVNGSTDLTEYTLTFEGQSAGWTNALVVAVTYPDGTTEFVAPGVNSDTDSWLISDWNNSKDIDEGSTLQFTVREDATVEYFLIPRVTEDKLDSMTYENGTVKYTNEHGDTVDAVSNMKVPGEEYGNTDSTTYRVEDGGGTDYNDFVFSEDKQDADFTLSGTTKADVLHGTTEADVLNGGPELGGLHSSELLPDGSFDALGADSSVRSSSNNGSENANLNSNGWSTESSLEVWHRGDGEDRNYFVELDSNTHKDGDQNYRESDLSRDISTKAGQEYTLSFKAAARESGEKMYVIIDGHEYEVKPSDYKNNDSSDWDTYSITFTAKDSSTRITLGQHESQNTGQHHIGIFVDDIAVTDDAGDELYGHAGNDTLNGGLGDDLLVGGAGADTLIGGEGFDTASYAGDNGGNGVTYVVNADGIASVTGGEATGDTVSSIERVVGSDHEDTLEIAGNGEYIVTLSTDANGLEQAVVTTVDGTHVITTVDFETIKFTDASDVKVIGLEGAKGVEVFTAEGKSVDVEIEAHTNSELSVTTGSEDDTVTISTEHTDGSAEVTVNTGAGRDTVELTEQADFKLDITGPDSAEITGSGIAVTAADVETFRFTGTTNSNPNTTAKLDVDVAASVNDLHLTTFEKTSGEIDIDAAGSLTHAFVETGDSSDVVDMYAAGGISGLDVRTHDGDDYVKLTGDTVSGTVDGGADSASGRDTLELTEQGDYKLDITSADAATITGSGVNVAAADIESFRFTGTTSSDPTITAKLDVDVAASVDDLHLTTFEKTSGEIDIDAAGSLTHAFVETGDSSDVVDMYAAGGISGLDVRTHDGDDYVKLTGDTVSGTVDGGADSASGRDTLELTEQGDYKLDITSADAATITGSGVNVAAADIESFRFTGTTSSDPTITAKLDVDVAASVDDLHLTTFEKTSGEIDIDAAGSLTHAFVETGDSSDVVDMYAAGGISGLDVRTHDGDDYVKLTGDTVSGTVDGGADSASGRDTLELTEQGDYKLDITSVDAATITGSGVNVAAADIESFRFTGTTSSDPNITAKLDVDVAVSVDDLHLTTFEKTSGEIDIDAAGSLTHAFVETGDSSDVVDMHAAGDISGLDVRTHGGDDYVKLTGDTVSGTVDGGADSASGRDTLELTEQGDYKLDITSADAATITGSGVNVAAADIESFRFTGTTSSDPTITAKLDVDVAASVDDLHLTTFEKTSGEIDIDAAGSLTHAFVETGDSSDVVDMYAAGGISGLDVRTHDGDDYVKLTGDTVSGTVDGGADSASGRDTLELTEQGDYKLDITSADAATITGSGVNVAAADIESFRFTGTTSSDPTITAKLDVDVAASVDDLHLTTFEKTSGEIDIDAAGSLTHAFVETGDSSDVVDMYAAGGISGLDVRTHDGDDYVKLTGDTVSGTVDGGADSASGRDTLELTEQGDYKLDITSADAATITGSGVNVAAADIESFRFTGTTSSDPTITAKLDVDVAASVDDLHLTTFEKTSGEIDIDAAGSLTHAFVETGDSSDVVDMYAAGGISGLDVRTHDGDDYVKLTGDTVSGTVDGGADSASGRDTLELTEQGDYKLDITSVDAATITGSGVNVAAADIESFRFTGTTSSDPNITAKLDVDVAVSVDDLHLTTFEKTSGEIDIDAAGSLTHAFVETGDSSDVVDMHAAGDISGLDVRTHGGDDYVKLTGDTVSGTVDGGADSASGRDTLELTEQGDYKLDITSADAATITGSGVNVAAADIESFRFTGTTSSDPTTTAKLDVDVAVSVDDLHLTTFEKTSGEIDIDAAGSLTHAFVETGNLSDVVDMHAAGDISGLDVRTNDGADRVIVSGEDVTGSIATGNGGDTIDLSGVNSGSVTVNAGDGSDTMLAGAATETFNGGSDVASVDTVNYAASKSAVNVDLSDANHDGIADARGSGGDAAGDSYSSIENITGSNHADTLTGNDFGNMIMGGDGAADGAILTEDFDGHGTHNWAATSGNKEINPHGIYNPGTNSGQNNVLEIDAERAVDAISTKVDTVAGQEYVFTFKALTRDHSSAEQNEVLIVKIGGKEFKVTPTRDDQNNDTDNLFETYSLRFTGTGGQTEITFTELESQSRSTHGVLVDDIALYAIDDIINGGGGNDTIFGEGGNDFLSGGDGSDFLHGGAGYDVAVYDGDFSDYTVTQNVDEAGHTYYTVGKGAEIDTVYDVESLQFNDRTLSPVEASIHDVPEGLIINGSSIDDSLNGKEGNDDISGKGGQDELHGHGGDDILHGGNGDDYLYGGSGKDSLYGDQGQDHLYGDDGNDTLKGVQGDDHLYGGSGEDTLYGGQGQDHLNGGAGDNDILNGGSGDDIFLFTADDFQKSGETTIIKDYGNGHDRLQFSDVISGSGEEQYAVSDVSHSGGDTTFTVTATQAGSTEALTHTIVLQDDISMDHAYLQHLLNSGS